MTTKGEGVRSNSDTVLSVIYARTSTGPRVSQACNLPTGTPSALRATLAHNFYTRHLAGSVSLVSACSVRIVLLALHCTSTMTVTTRVIARCPYPLKMSHTASTFMTLTVGQILNATKHLCYSNQTTHLRLEPTFCLTYSLVSAQTARLDYIYSLYWMLFRCACCFALYISAAFPF